jgi:hypothetical protein
MCFWDAKDLVGGQVQPHRERPLCVHVEADAAAPVRPTDLVRLRTEGQQLAQLNRAARGADHRGDTPPSRSAAAERLRNELIVECERTRGTLAGWFGTHPHLSPYGPESEDPSLEPGGEFVRTSQD